MSHFLKAILCLLLASTHCLASVTAQPRPTMTVDDNGFVTLAWLSLPGHTYFMQCSFDMVAWTYFGEVIHSGFGIEKVTFDPTTDDHVYFRIVASDIPTYDATNDDFNGDGISNQDSIDQGIDPIETPSGILPPNQPHEDGYSYSLIVTQQNGVGPGTRYYRLDQDYRQVTVSNETFHPFPIAIAAEPAPAPQNANPVTEVTFTSVAPVTHDTPIDLIFYTSTPNPASSGTAIRTLKKIEALIIPKGASSVTLTPGYTGSPDNAGVAWHIAPIVVRGIDQTHTPETIGSWDSGVDHTSRRAAATDIGSKTNTWILAPGNGIPNRIEIEANAPFGLNLTSSVSTLAPANLINPKATFDLSALLNANGEVDENHSDLEIGLIDPDPTQAPGDVKISTNVRIKSLERRTLKVNIYPITSAVPGRPDATVSPNFIQQEIQTYFDRVYLSQANLKCQIVLKPATIITWDNSTEGNYSQPFENQAEHPKVDDTFLDITTGVVSPEIAQIVQTDPNGNSIFNGQLLPRNELHLFLMGGCTFIRTINTSPPNNRITERHGRGFADISNDRCFVVASTIPESPHSIDVMASIRPQILNTMAHEIGHLIITFGHPDQYNPTVNDPNDPLAHGGGPAPLAMDAFLHQRRLMASGLIRNLGRELVLEEWNEIRTKVDVLNSLSPQNGN